MFVVALLSFVRCELDAMPFRALKWYTWFYSQADLTLILRVHPPSLSLFGVSWQRDSVTMLRRAITFPTACLSSTLYLVVMLLAAQDSNLGTRMAAASVNLGTAILGALSAAVLVSAWLCCYRDQAQRTSLACIDKHHAGAQTHLQHFPGNWHLYDGRLQAGQGGVGRGACTKP